MGIRLGVDDRGPVQAMNSLEFGDGHMSNLQVVDLRDHGGDNVRVEGCRG